jgi:uncharacterized membrane protein YdbT with pleckstrin-like domain
MTIPWHKPQRPSPVIFLTGLTDIVKETFGYLILFLVLSLLGKKEEASAKPNTFSYYMLFLLIAVLLFKFQKLLAWFFTRYWVEDNKVILTKGVFVKSRVELPIEKIQTIQIKQNVLHRLTSTCTLTMDTAGSSTPEFMIEAMRLDTATALQGWLKNIKKESTEAIRAINTENAKAKPDLHLDTTGLLKLCITENHLRSLFIILFFTAGKLHELSQQLGSLSNEAIDAQIESFRPTVLAIIVLTATALAIAILFSAVQVLFRYFGYKVSLLTQAYQMEWGLFTRHHKTMPHGKVQFITWSANWLRSQMKLYILRLHSLADPIATEDLEIKMPITSNAMLYSLLQPYGYAANTEPQAVYGICKALIHRHLLLIGLPIAALAMGIMYAAQLSIWWLPLLWLAYYAGTQWVLVQRYRIQFFTNMLHIRKGVWGQNHLLTNYTNIIHVSIHTGPWQRSHGYANLRLHLPGMSWTIPYLKEADAKQIADFILFEIEASREKCIQNNYPFQNGMISEA